MGLKKNIVEKIILAIPARLESKRLPGKIMADICGKPMIKRVLENCSKAKGYDGLFLCTDNLELKQLVEEWGYKTILTSSECNSGSERIASVVDEIIFKAWDLNFASKESKNISKLISKTAIVNVQGDQPFIDPNVLNLMSKRILNYIESFDVITPVYELDKKDIHNSSVVKTVLNSQGNALYFSRSALPHIRGVEECDWYKYSTYWGHVGIYGFRAEILKLWFSLPNSKLEKTEQLEQLKVLESGYKISTFKIEGNSLSVDTIEQLEEARKIARNNTS